MHELEKQIIEAKENLESIKTPINIGGSHSQTMFAPCVLNYMATIISALETINRELNDAVMFREGAK